MVCHDMLCGVCRELVDCGVVETLVALLRSSLVKERTNAARALGNMSTEPYVRTRIVSAGAVEGSLAYSPRVAS